MTRFAARSLAFFSAAAVAVSVAASAHAASSVRLHDVVGVEGDAVTLADVAELDGPAAGALAATVVGRFADGSDTLAIAVADVRRAMDDAGVNWAMVSLSGFSRCTVKRLAPAGPAAAAAEAGPVAVASNLSNAVTLASAATLRGVVEAKLIELAGGDAGDVRIAFDDADAARLRASALAHRYEVTPSSATGLGRVPVEVVRYELDRPVDRFHVSATVERRFDALVTTRTIDRGALITDAAVDLRAVYLDHAPSPPLHDASLAVGQVAASRLPPGTPVFADHVRAETLVKRGGLVTVRAIAGNVVVRTVARATEDGGMDDLVRLRNERSRDTFVAVVTGRNQCVIHVAEPVKPAAAGAGDAPRKDS